MRANRLNDCLAPCKTMVPPSKRVVTLQFEKGANSIIDGVQFVDMGFLFLSWYILLLLFTNCHN